MRSKLYTVLLLAAVAMSAMLCSCSCSNSGQLVQGDSVNLAAGENYTLEADCLGADYTWSSEDEGVAVVSDNGEIVAVGPGETFVTVTVDGKDHRVKVTVDDNDVEVGSASDAQSASVAGADIASSEFHASSSSAKADSNAPVSKEVETEQRNEAIDKVPLNNVATIYGADVTAHAGDTGVQMYVFVERNPGILGMILTAHFDDEALTLTDAVNGDAVKNVLTLTKSKDLVDGCKFVWDGVDIEEYQAYDGAILVLTFDVADDAPPGTYEVGFSYDNGDIVNGKLVPVDVNIIGGSITVE